MVDLTEDLFEGTNWNDVPDAPPAVPSGEYHVKVTKVEQVKSKQKQTPGIALDFLIQSGEFAGRNIHQNLWVTEKTRWAVKQMFGKRGFDLITADGRNNYKGAEGWEGIVKLTTKVEEGNDFPDYRVKLLSVLK
jgi:hypothetical protein